MRGLLVVAAVSLGLVSACNIHALGPGNGLSFAMHESGLPEDGIPIGVIMAEDLQPALNLITQRSNDKVPEILLRINSPGGGVYTGLQFIQALEDLAASNGTKFICVVDTEASSMAFVILQSGACHVRLMTKRSALLAHNAWTVVRGGEKEIEQTLKHLQITNFQMAVMVSDRLGMPLEEYQKKIDGKDWMLNYKDALFYNAVDDLVDPKDLPPLVKLPEPPPALFTF